MTIEGYDGERVLLSYDVSGSHRAVAARVCQIVFGRRRVSEGPEHVRYREKGFIHRPGVVWVGQSVSSCLPEMRWRSRHDCAESGSGWPWARSRTGARPWRRSVARPPPRPTRV